MSKVKDLAEAEARRAEAEHPDDDDQEGEAEGDQQPEPAEGEPEPQPEPQPEPAEPVDVEAFTREAKRHEKAVAKLLGPAVVENVCSHCQGVGYLPPGADAAPEPQHHDDFQACQTCSGYGDVLTGSLKEGHQTASCPTCAGTGYLVRQARHDGEANGSSGAGDVVADFGAEPWMGDPNIRPPQQPGFGAAAGTGLGVVR